MDVSISVSVRDTINRNIKTAQRDISFYLCCYQTIFLQVLRDLYSAPQNFYVVVA